MFSDQTFDTVASISTIEHIGLNNAMLYTGDPEDAESDENGFVPAVQEFRRILKARRHLLHFGAFRQAGQSRLVSGLRPAMVEKIVEVFAPGFASNRLFRVLE